MNLLPTTSGTYQGEISSDFLPSLAARVRSGLFPHASANRNHYEIVSQDTNSLHFRSKGLWTGISVGLNDVTVSVDRDAGSVRFDIAYWTWAKYAIALCAFIVGWIPLFLILRPMLPANFQGANHPAMALGMFVFWGFVWPWILIGIHKSNVRLCLTKIFDQVLEKST